MIKRPRGLHKCFIQHGDYCGEHRSVRNGIADNISAVQVKDWGEIELLPKETKFGNVSHPLLVWLVSLKISVQSVGSNFPNLPLVGMVLLHPHRADKAELLHQPLHTLVV